MDLSRSWAFLTIMLVSVISPLSTTKGKNTDFLSGSINMRRRLLSIQGESPANNADKEKGTPQTMTNEMKLEGSQSSVSPQLLQNKKKKTPSVEIQASGVSTVRSTRRTNRRSRKKSSRRSSRRRRKHEKVSTRNTTELKKSVRTSDKSAVKDGLTTPPRANTKEDTVSENKKLKFPTGSSQNSTKLSTRKATSSSTRGHRKNTKQLPLKSESINHVTKSFSAAAGKNVQKTTVPSKSVENETSKISNRKTVQKTYSTTILTPTTSGLYKDNSMSTINITPSSQGMSESAHTGHRFDEHGSTLKAKSSKEIGRIFTEPFSSTSYTTSNPVALGIPENIQSSQTNKEILPLSSSDRTKTKSVTSGLPEDPRQDLRAFEIKKTLKSVVELDQNTADMDRQSLTRSKGYEVSTIIDENIGNGIQQQATSSQSENVFDNSIGVFGSSTMRVSSENTTPSTTNTLSLPTSKPSTHKQITETQRQNPMTIASILARVLPQILGSSHAIVRHLRPRAIITRNDGSFIVPLLTPRFLNVNRRRLRMSSLQPQYLGFFRKRALCFETPRRLRKMCRTDTDCQHQMKCYSRQCCATSDAHAEMLENMLENMDRPRIRIFRLRPT